MNTEPLTIFSELREAIVDRLKMSDDIKGPPCIEVVSFDQSDLESRINRILVEKIGGDSAAGIAIIVGNVGFEPGESRNELTATLGITLTENVVINQGDLGSKKRTEDLQATIYALLTFANDGISPWYPSETWSELILRDSAIQEVGMQVTYTMTFETSAHIRATEEPTPQPVI